MSTPAPPPPPPRRTPHGTSCLVQALSAWLGKTRRAPSWHSKDARVYGHTTTAMHKLSTPPPRPPSPNTSRRFALGAGNDCLVGENPTCSVSYRYCRDVRVNCLKTTAMHEINTPPPTPSLYIHCRVAGRKHNEEAKAELCARKDAAFRRCVLGMSPRDKEFCPTVDAEEAAVHDLSLEMYAPSSHSLVIKVGLQGGGRNARALLWKSHALAESFVQR